MAEEDRTYDLLDSVVRAKNRTDNSFVDGGFSWAAAFTRTLGRYGYSLVEHKKAIAERDTLARVKAYCEFMKDSPAGTGAVLTADSVLAIIEGAL